MTKKNEMPDLLPCPFCGGDASLNSTVFAGLTNEYRVNCKECVAQTEIGFTPEEGVEFWNTRADLADARVEKLREALDQALRQWQMYSDIQNASNEDLMTTDLPEGDLYRKCKQAHSETETR